VIGIKVKTTTAEHSLNPGPVATRRICMVTHSFYESDNRVLRYAEALVKSAVSWPVQVTPPASLLRFTV
jgi:hypothetical protein